MCWLALLRIAETTGATCKEITDELGPLTLGVFTNPSAHLRQTAELTNVQRELLAKLGSPHPKKVIDTTDNRLTSSNAITY